MMYGAARWSALALCCAALLACEEKQDTPPPASATNPTASWRMAPELRIAVTPAPADTIDVIDLETGPDTSVYALQPVQHRIVVWDASGKFRRMFGQEQLRAPTRLGWHSGVLWVWEPSLKRLTRFRPDGVLLDRATILQNTRLPRETDLEAVLTDTTVLLSTVLSRDSASGNARRALLRAQRNGTVLDTIALISDRHSALQVRWGNGALQTAQPFGERTYFGYSAIDGMVVFAHADSLNGKPVLRVTKVNQVGDTLFSRPLPYEPKAFNANVVAPVVNRLIQASRRLWTGTAPADDELRRGLFAGLYAPERLPTITDLLVATDGSILLRREEEVDQVNWTIVEPTNGRVVAEQRGPAKARALLAGGPFFFAAEHEPRTIPEVVRYRLLRN